MRKASLFAVFLAVLLSVGVSYVGAEGGLSGTVLETMDSGGYTYVLIENNGQKAWVAIPQAKLEVGQKVSFQPAMPMTNFKSKSLNREFDVIYFSGGLAQ